MNHACAGVIADPGVGKTSISLAALKIIKKMKMPCKTLIIAPRRPIYEVWPKEIEKWEDFNHFIYKILHGPKKDELLRVKSDIDLITPEGLEWLLQVEKIKLPSGKIKVKIDKRRFKRLGYDIVIVDELSNFKNTQSQRFKAMKEVIGLFSRRWGLTGSPAANGLMGLFGQCYILDEGRTLGRYITHYRNKYFDANFNGFGWSLREGSKEQIFKAVKPLMIRLEAKGLPPVVNNDIIIDLPEAAKKVYRELDDELFALIQDEGVISAPNNGVARMKCRQVASGGIYLDPEIKKLVKIKDKKRKWVLLHDEKTDALKELINDLQGNPLLIAYEFQHELERIRGAFKNMPFIGGGTTDKEASHLISEWNKGNLPYMAGHPKSIGHGLNMQGDNAHVCWYTLPEDFELYDQFIRRIRRRGTKAQRIFNHRLIAKDTIDEDVKISLSSKDHTQQDFFNAIKSRMQRLRKKK